MNGADHFHEAERLLLDCQIAPATATDPAVYPDSEEGRNTTRNALVAALVHATLALALVEARGVAASTTVPPGPCPAAQEMTLGAPMRCDLRAGHGGDHEHGRPDDGAIYARWGS